MWQTPVFPLTTANVTEWVPATEGVYVLWAQSGGLMGCPSYQVVFAGDGDDLRARALAHCPGRERLAALVACKDVVFQYAPVEGEGDRAAIVRWLFRRYQPGAAHEIPTDGPELVTNLPHADFSCSRDGRLHSVS